MVLIHRRLLRKAVCHIAGLVAAMGVALALSDGLRAAPIKVVAFGDSLIAGFGLPSSQSLPSQLEGALKAEGLSVQVINSGVSGDTTAAALSRFDWAIPQDADAAIVALGANDALRGLPVKQARENLTRIVERLKDRGLPVLLLGLPSPSNYGPEYQSEFSELYTGISQEFGTLLVPDFLEGVAKDPRLNQSDGLHPNGEGVAEIVRRLLPKVRELVTAARAKAS